MSEKKYDLKEVVDTIVKETDGIYVIDTSEDYYYSLYSSKLFDCIFGKEGKYSDMFKTLLFHMNNSSDNIIDGYMEFITDLKSFNGRYGRVVKIFYHDNPIIAQMNVYPLPEENKSIIQLIKIDECEYMEDIQKKAKEAVIQEGYLFTMYVNLSKDCCHAVEVTEMDSATQKYSSLSYSKWRKIIVNMIHKDDQSMFMNNTEPEYLMNRLKDRNSTSFECQMQNLQGLYKWVRLTFSKIQSLRDNEFKFVYMVQDIHESSMRLLRDVKKLEEISNRDTLTGVYNHGKIEDELYRYVELGKRKSDVLSLFMLDIDHFKNINDTYGHSTGDEVLKQLSIALLKYTQLKGIILGRWGGEEFFGICDGSGIDMVTDLAEDIRCLVENIKFTSGCRLTCSVGVIEVNPNEAARAAFDRVDKAVYAAKKAGRNCVMKG